MLVPDEWKRLTPPRLAVLIASAGMAAWMWYSYSGLFRWVAEACMRVTGLHSAKLAFFLSFVSLYLLGRLVLTPFEMYVVGRRSAVDPNRVEAARGSARPHLAVPRAGSLLLLAALGLTVYGGTLVFLPQKRLSAARNAPPVPSAMDLGAVEAGASPPATWVRVRGIPLAGRELEFGDTRYTSVYTPVTSRPDGVRPPVRLVLIRQAEGTNGRPTTLPTGGEFEGLFIGDSLPGPVRAAWERDGLGDLKDAYVLNIDTSPQRVLEHAGGLEPFGAAIAGLGVVVGVAGLLCWRASVRSPRAAAE